MSGISGKKRENVESVKKIGLFEGKVIAINPTAEEFSDVLGITLPEDKEITYLDEKDGVQSLRLEFWMEDVRSKHKMKVTFFLKDTVRLNREGTKTQYINDIGTTTWADEESNLPEWFVKKDYREAKVGEEQMYKFLRTWLGNLDYRDASTTLNVDWKKLMKGNVSELKAQLGGELTTNLGCLATVKHVDKDGETKQYQGVYDRDFLPVYMLKHFRLNDYNNPETIKAITAKQPKDRKMYEKFALSILDSEHGCKDSFTLKDLRDYDPANDFIASNAVLSEEGSDY
jgi:hypothetical protein